MRRSLKMMAATGGALALSAKSTIEKLKFDNTALRELPVDPVPENYVRTVRNAVFSRVQPAPVEKPRLVVLSTSALTLLGLDPDEVNRPDFVEYFGGNKLIPGSDPAAHCYCGHQFGSFAGQLGDGAAMLLGEVVVDEDTVSGRAQSQASQQRQRRIELQFKGSGKTPYSRTADGRKVLRSSLREFLCSEAFHALGVPTTRAGTVVTSDTKVVRDIFYTGEPIQERVTVITRLAPTFIRFGSFEIFKPRDEQTGAVGPSVGNTELLKQLLDYVCKHHYPEIHSKFPDEAQAPQRYLEMYKEVCLRSARLVAAWQSFGWCHGVLNTDNLSIIGVTLDYGPYGWMEKFDPDWICNTSDDGGRYTYANQPSVVQWNCAKLGEAIEPALAGLPWKLVLKVYATEFRRSYNERCRRKLGLGYSQPSDGAAAAGIDSNGSKTADSDASGSASGGGSGSGGMSSEDEELFQDLLDIMNATGADFTSTFRALMLVDIGGRELKEAAARFRAAGLGIEVQDQQPQRPVTDDGGANSINKKARSTNDSAASASVSITPTREQHNDNVGDPASAAPSSASAAAAQASAGPLVDPGLDTVLDTIMASCASAAEIAESKKPRTSWEKLHHFLSLAQSNPYFASQLDGINQELENHRVYELLKGRSDEEKDEQDRALWADWLERYRKRLFAELPEAVRDSVVAEIRAEVSGSPQASQASAATSSSAAAAAELQRLADARRSLMAHSNPKYILRNWYAHVAIKAAESGDFSESQRLLRRLEDPFGFGDADPNADEFSESVMAKARELGLSKDDADSGQVETFANSSSAGSAAADSGDAGDQQPATIDVAAMKRKKACNTPSWASGLKVSCSS